MKEVWVPWGPRGPRALTYPVGPVRQVSQYFGEGEGWHSAQPLTVAGPNYKSPRVRTLGANSADIVVRSVDSGRGPEMRPIS